MRYSQKTRPWIITVSVGVLVLLYFLIIWLLVGEINLCDKFYIVPVNGELWHGKISNDNIDWLWNSFSKWINVTKQDLIDYAKDHPDDVASLHASVAVFNPIVLVYIFGGIGIAIIYPFIFKWLKIGNYDILPFSITTAIVCLIFFVTALIPAWVNVNDFWRELLRLAISVFCGFICFFFINWIVNKIYITNNNAQLLANELKVEKKASDVYNNDLRKMVDDYRQQDHDYVDLDDLSKKK